LRRITLVAAGFAVAAVLVFAGVAGASPLTTGQHVKPGGVWTEENKEGGCEVQTFGPGSSFSADIGGDSGTYTGGGRKITETWTQGQDSGLTLSGKYSISRGKYVVTFGGFDAGDTGFLVKGVVSTWNGFSC
jgi:hypothetical protein